MLKRLFKSLHSILRNRHWLYFTMSFTGVMVFVLLPFARTIYQSLYCNATKQFVGMTNYRMVLQNDAFVLAMKNTGRLLIFGIPLLLLLSFLLALLITQKVQKERIKTIYLIPMAIPTAAVVLAWKIFFYKKGMLNQLLGLFGIMPVDWLNSNASFWVLVFSYIWKNLGYTLVLWLAGLDSIPESRIEAAKCDGADSGELLRYIILPSLKPFFYTITILSLLNSFRIYREAYLVAGAYPQQNMYLFQHLLHNWFAGLEVDKISASAVFLTTIFGVFVMVLEHLWNREGEKDSLPVFRKIKSEVQEFFYDLSVKLSIRKKVKHIFAPAFSLKLKKILEIIIIAVIGFVIVYPVLLVLAGSLKSNQELSNCLGGILSDDAGEVQWKLTYVYPTLSHFKKLLFETPQFLKVFWNSLGMVSLILIGQVLVAVPAAYGFAKWKFNGKKLLFFVYVILMLIPFQITMYPSYLVLRDLKLINTIWAVILPTVFSTFPVFLMYRSFREIPVELYEAAKMDGAGEWAMFWHIGIPLGQSGIFSALVLGFLDYWNMMEQPLAFIQDKSLWPISLFLPEADGIKTGLLLAASVITLIPALFVFSIGQNYLEKGIVASGVKE